jgi:hypothetical protein
MLLNNVYPEKAWGVFSIRPTVGDPAPNAEGEVPGNPGEKQADHEKSRLRPDRGIRTCRGTPSAGFS